LNWIAQSILATLSFSAVGLLVVYQIQRGMSSQFAMFIIALVWLPSYGIWSWKRGIDFTISPVSILLILSAAILSVIGNWAAFESAAKAPNPGMASAIVACQAVVIAIAAKYVLGSELTWTQMSGIGLVTSGIILMFR
jgi:drug/metabolite transporter (DMT)-like permease